MVLAANGYGPVGFWLKMPLSELHKWIAVNNQILEERRNEE